MRCRHCGFTDQAERASRNIRFSEWSADERKKYEDQIVKWCIALESALSTLYRQGKSLKHDNTMVPRMLENLEGLIFNSKETREQLKWQPHQRSSSFHGRMFKR